MSRIGKQPIPVPAGVEVKIDGSTITVTGSKGTLVKTFTDVLSYDFADGIISVVRSDDERITRSLHGLTRTLINNMVVGVSEGFSKKLELVGVGYRAALKGETLDMQLGYSHPVVIEPLEGISFEVPAPTQIIVKGIDKQQVGQQAADIRKWRKPEPYKGKGIKYEGEYIRRKLGKAASK